MPSLTRAIYSPVLLDIAFGLLGAGSLVLLVMASGQGAPAIEPVDEPLRKGLSLAAVVLVSGLVAAFASRADQKCADDFVFMTLAKSGVIGMVGLLIFAGFWEALFADNLGALPGLGMIPVALACWSIGYFYTRIRGTRA